MLIAFLLDIKILMTISEAPDAPYELQRGAVFIYEGNVYMIDEAWKIVFVINVTDYKSELNTILLHVHKIGTFIPSPGMTKSPIGVETQAVQVNNNMILVRIYKLWT